MSITWMRQEVCTGYDPTGLVPVVKQAEKGRRCPAHPCLPPPKSSVKSSVKGSVKGLAGDKGSTTQETTQETRVETSVKTSVKASVKTSGEILHTVGGNQ